MALQVLPRAPRDGGERLPGGLCTNTTNYHDLPIASGKRSYSRTKRACKTRFRECSTTQKHSCNPQRAPSTSRFGLLFPSRPTARALIRRSSTFASTSTLSQNRLTDSEDNHTRLATPPRDKPSSARTTTTTLVVGLHLLHMLYFTLES